jgi:MFS family permease
MAATQALLRVVSAARGRLSPLQSRIEPARVDAGLAAMFFAICAATYVINAADRMIFPVVLRPVATEYGFTLAQGGFLATIYLAGLGIGGIGTGHLLDHLSRRTTMIVGILIYSFFTLLTAAAQGFYDMAGYRVLTGVGEAMQNVALVIAVSAFYPRSRALAIGLIFCALGVGQFLGPRLGATLAAGGDWRLPFYAFGIAGLFGALALCFVGKGFTEQKSAGAALAPTDPGFDAHIPNGLWNRNSICVMLVVTLRSFPFYAFLGLYTTFLTTERGFTLAEASAALSLFGLGPFFSPLAGYIADRVNQKLFQIACLATMAVAGFLIFNVATTPLEHNILALVMGLGGGFAYVNGYSLVQRCVKNALIGRASGYFYAIGTFPTAISGYLLAKLVSVIGWGPGATIMMSALLVLPILISLLIDTSQITGNGRSLSGRRLWT